MWVDLYPPPKAIFAPPASQLTQDSVSILLLRLSVVLASNTIFYYIKICVKPRFPGWFWNMFAHFVYVL